MRFGCEEKAKSVDVSKWHLYYTWKPVKALSGDNKQCTVMFELVWRKAAGPYEWEYRTVEYAPLD